MSAPPPDGLIDAVDLADEPVTRTERRSALEAGFNFRVVHVFVFNSEGELLVQRLAPTRERHGGRWGSSVAGFIHAGETPGSAARRRLFEELGIRSEVRLFGVVPMHDEGSIKFVSLFVARADAPRDVDREHIAELTYVPLDALVDDIAASPEDFTDTFRLLATFYRSTAGLAETLPFAGDLP